MSGNHEHTLSLTSDPEQPPPPVLRFSLALPARSEATNVCIQPLKWKELELAAKLVDNYNKVEQQVSTGPCVLKARLRFK